ncbi:UNVERIFIED_CONTAM: hypothetical protein GTU68_001253 [Idotea baltica]|nr:hypothetical protein [Idotea baltica]
MPPKFGIIVSIGTV